MNLDERIEQARRAVIDKALKEYPVPMNDEERMEDRIVMWMDPSEFTLYDGKGNEVTL